MPRHRRLPRRTLEPSPPMHGTGAGADPEADGVRRHESGDLLGIHGNAVSPAELAQRSVTSFGRCRKTRCAAGTRGGGGRRTSPGGAGGGAGGSVSGADACSVSPPARPPVFARISLCLVRKGILRYLLQRGISEFWAQAGLDCIVNGYMLGVGCSEIAALRPCQVPIPAEIPRYVLATVYLRCELLGCADEIRPMLICAGELDAVDMALLEDVANRFTGVGGNRKTMSSAALAEELRALQAVFGPHQNESCDNESDDFIDPAIKQSVISTSTNARARWGELEHIVVPHTKPHVPARTALRRRPGCFGPLRYPHRVIVPGDGQAFAQQSRVMAGTALIDCSGSMSLDESKVRQLMAHLPAVEIALYSGQLNNTAKGWLCVIARNGRLADLASVLPSFGGYNVVDGPALRWLATRRPPRFWISDGAANGVGGAQSKSLFADVVEIMRQSTTKRLSTLTALLEYTRQLKRNGT